MLDKIDIDTIFFQNVEENRLPWIQTFDQPDRRHTTQPLNQ